MSLKLGIIMGLGMLAGCQQSSESQTHSANCEKLTKFDPAKADNDALQEIKAGRRYLLGVYGYARTIPGGEVDGLHARYIEGTSDYECHELNDRAVQYAFAFNATMRRESGPQ